MDMLSMPRIKRERLIKAQQLKKKTEMRAALPVLTREEIRKFRLPYYEAILLELEEQGYASACEFLKQLLEYQENLRAEHGPDTPVWSRPRLMESREHLDRLQDGFKVAETAHYSEDCAKECDEMIKLAVYYLEGSSDWWWLAEQLLIQCVNISQNYKEDYSRREAVSRYISAQFYLFKQTNLALAKEHLEIARELSAGKSWSAKKELNRKQDTISVEVCVLLYRALLDEAKEMMSYDPLQAAQICALARKRAADACNKAGEAESLKMQGLCEMAAGDPKSAATSFFKALTLQVAIKDMEKICEAKINLALSYLMSNRTAEAHFQLKNLMVIAEDHNLVFYIGQAYRYLGEFYLNQGQPNLATPLLIQALNIFHDIEDLLNREQARNLAAISAGQELMPRYISLILKCGNEGQHGNTNVFKLVKWKDTRELFWSESDILVNSSVRSFEQALISTGRSGSSLSYNLPDIDEHVEVAKPEYEEEEVDVEDNEDIVTASSASDLLDIQSSKRSEP